MSRVDFMKTVKAIEHRNAGSRHLRRKEEALARQKSIPAIKKIIRRNKQRRK